MKAKDQEKLDTLRFLLSKIKNQEIEKKSELNDEEVVNIIRKQVKELNESIDSFQKGGRNDLITTCEAQKKILTEYLPPEISDDELKAELQKLKDANADMLAKNPKAIFGIAMRELKAKADPQRITKAINETL